MAVQEHYSDLGPSPCHSAVFHAPESSVDKHTCVICSPPFSRNSIQHSPCWGLSGGSGDHGLKSLNFNSWPLALGKRESDYTILAHSFSKCLWGRGGAWGRETQTLFLVPSRAQGGKVKHTGNCSNKWERVREGTKFIHGEEREVWHSCLDWGGFLEEAALD